MIFFNLLVLQHNLAYFQECSFRLQEGASEYLQIMQLGCVTIIALKE